MLLPVSPLTISSATTNLSTTHLKTIAALTAPWHQVRLNPPTLSVTWRMTIGMPLLSSMMTMKAPQTKLSRLALVALSNIALGRARNAAETATKMRCWVATLLIARW
jgi:hypothetical protein